MNQYLISIFNAVGIDVNHLRKEYLSANELMHLNKALQSEQDLEQHFYTGEHGENLECLLFFLHSHKNDIIKLMQGKGREETLIELYTSSTISGGYDCFRFNLSKFPQTYTQNNQVMTLYRIGRDGECEGNLGCSWAKSIDGLRAYCDASNLSRSILESKPIFVITIDDSQVLFEGKESEQELVLKPNFTHHTLAMLDDELRSKVGR
ncbi:hypothetical protein [Photobacterium nomapromontoriensis]|uniref:hypothetical protein n=1 Tax=Photobacterium nomapromontoriensis TaxID=2910237 RepID=UPI003D0A3C0B